MEGIDNRSMSDDLDDDEGDTFFVGCFWAVALIGLAAASAIVAFRVASFF